MDSKALIVDAISKFLLIDNQQITIVVKDVILKIIRYYYHLGVCVFGCTLYRRQLGSGRYYALKIDCRDHFSLLYRNLSGDSSLWLDFTPIFGDMIIRVMDIILDYDFVVLIDSLKAMLLESKKRSIELPETKLVKETAVHVRTRFPEIRILGYCS